jgi:hypothetical protein
MAAVTIDMARAIKSAADVKARKNLVCHDGQMDSAKRPRRVGMRKAPVKESAFQTFKTILGLFKRKSVAGLSEVSPGVYMILTSNAQIARMRHVSERTVMRHRKALQDAGLIEGGACHGPYAQYELHVKAEHLGLAEALDAAEVRKGLEAALEEAREAEQSSHVDILSHNLPVIDTNADNGTVEKRPGAAASGRLRAPGGREADGTQEAGLCAALGPEGAAGAAPGGDPLQGLDADHAGEIRTLAGILWTYARGALWPSMAIEPWRERQVAGLVHGIYARVPRAELGMWHNRMTGMVGIAGKYLGRTPTPRLPGKGVAAGKGPEKLRYIVPPWKWFDTKVPHGIAGVWPWWVKANAWREASKADHELWAAVSKWEANNRRPPSRRRDPARLYQVLRARVASWGRPQLLAQFDAAIATAAAIIKPDDDGKGKAA